jgi:hypothetical protein
MPMYTGSPFELSSTTQERACSSESSVGEWILDQRADTPPRLRSLRVRLRRRRCVSQNPTPTMTTTSTTATKTPTQTSILTPVCW